MIYYVIGEIVSVMARSKNLTMRVASHNDIEVQVNEVEGEEWRIPDFRWSISQITMPARIYREN